MDENKIFAVLGAPVLHSKSPNLFNPFFKEYQKPYRYIRLYACSAVEGVKAAKGLGFSGINVTAPFKEEVLSFSEEISEEASAINAANTLVFTEEKTRAYNTDFYGVVRSLEEAQVKLEKSTAVVLGSGGAGRAAAYGLLKAGCKVTLVNRSREKGEAAAQRLGCPFLVLEEAHSLIRSSDILVLAIPRVPGDFLKKLFRPGMYVFDATYHHPIFQKEAEKAGCHAIAGISWLVHQALPAYQHFTGQRILKEQLTRALQNSYLLDKTKNISLIGFMGSGKSTIGPLLAKALKRNFIDLDSMIEEEAGKSIADIFKDDGEEAFRDRETEALQKLCSRDRLVISCGGGIVGREKNRELLRSWNLNIWLYSDLDSSLKRAADGSRPLLDIKNGLDQAKLLFKKRIFLYADTADLCLVCGDKTPEELTGIIHDEITAL